MPQRWLENYLESFVRYFETNFIQRLSGWQMYMREPGFPADNNLLEGHHAQIKLKNDHRA
jgi:hypothetical protein